MSIECFMTVGHSKELRAVTTTDAEHIKGLKYGERVKVKIYSGDRRSLGANALFHIWCREAAAHFKIQEVDGVPPEQSMKSVFKHMFLGYKDMVCGKLVIQNQLKNTSDLQSGPMCEFMEKVQAWCAEKGCALSNPGDNEYMKWQKEQNR